MRYNKLILVFLLTCVMLFSCKGRLENLDDLEVEMKTMGYSGDFLRPSNTLIIGAMALFGIHDYLALSNPSNSIAVVKFNNEDNLTDEKIERILNFVVNNLSGAEKEEVLNNMHRLQDNSIRHGRYMIIWENDRPDDIIKLISDMY